MMTDLLFFCIRTAHLYPSNRLPAMAATPCRDKRAIRRAQNELYASIFSFTFFFMGHHFFTYLCHPFRTFSYNQIKSMWISRLHIKKKRLHRVIPSLWFCSVHFSFFAICMRVIIGHMGVHILWFSLSTSLPWLSVSAEMPRIVIHPCREGKAKRDLLSICKGWGKNKKKSPLLNALLSSLWCQDCWAGLSGAALGVCTEKTAAAAHFTMFSYVCTQSLKAKDSLIWPAIKVASSQQRKFKLAIHLINLHAEH